MQRELLLSLIVIFAPIGIGILTFFIPKKVKYLRESLAFIVSGCALSAALLIFLAKEIKIFSFPLFEIFDFKLNFILFFNPLNKFLLLFATGFGFLIVLYSLKYMADNNRAKEYYLFLLITIGCTSGVLLSDHLIIFILFWEIVSVSLYFLITTGGPEARKGATKSLIMIAASDACLLIGIGMLWFLNVNHSLIISEIIVKPLQMNSFLSYTSFILIMIGAFTKAGSMPFHTWIPAASKAAPASVMALLPASLDKLLGIYLLFMVATKFFILSSAMQIVLMVIGALTIVIAVMMALVQHHLPKLLSYHAISQVGYMVLGIGTYTPLGMVGGLFHMLNNSIYKNCLFLCGGAVQKKTKTYNLEKLGGLARTMPITFIGCLIASLSISGVPPFNGFVSKWMIYQGTVQTVNQGSWFSIFFLIAAMFGSALTLASFIKVLYSTFLGRKSKITKNVKKDVGITMQLPIIILAILCILFGVFYYQLPVKNFFIPSMANTEFAISAPEQISANWQAPLAAALILGGLVVGFLIYLIGRIKTKSRTESAFIGGEAMETEEARVPGTTFYNTIKAIKPLGALYKTQEKGWFDPYVLFARVGVTFSKALKALHNGILPFYLVWALIGIGILITLLIIF